MIKRIAGCLLLVSAFGVAPAAAQEMEAESEPGVLVVSQNKCAFDTSELNEWVSQTLAPALDDVVADGHLMDWGVMQHAWGDEWNWVIWYAAEDVASFHEGFNAALSAVMSEHPDFLGQLNEYCTEHKDNIYNVVM